MTLEAFELVARTRRAVRRFRPDPLPAGVLERLLEAARWAPSGYNLQPTHMVVVTEAGLKRALWRVCLQQGPVLEAPAVVVFAGDRDAYRHRFEDILKMEREAGTISPEYERKLRRVVPLAFEQGPLGLGWLWKAVLPPVLRLFRPVPSIPAVHGRFWVTKQVMLAAMNFMLAAQAAGLATVPMEGFDERGVRKVLGVPRRCVVAVVIPVGYAADGVLRKTRLPLSASVHHNGW